MKKLILSFAILGFIAFGALSIQNLTAATSQVEIVNFDKDPKKDGDKKASKAKEAKVESSSKKDCSKDCSSSCSGKTASAKSCCDYEKAASCCSKSGTQTAKK
jgi:hypothetical protein